MEFCIYVCSGGFWLDLLGYSERIEKRYEEGYGVGIIEELVEWFKILVL